MTTPFHICSLSLIFFNNSFACFSQHVVEAIRRFFLRGDKLRSRRVLIRSLLPIITVVFIIAAALARSLSHSLFFRVHVVVHDADYIHSPLWFLCSA